MGCKGYHRLTITEDDVKLLLERLEETNILLEEASHKVNYQLGRSYREAVGQNSMTIERIKGKDSL